MEDDWADYDTRKKEQNLNCDYFVCSCSWEVDYLVNKILTCKPGMSQIEIRQAIAIYSISVDTPHTRRAVVEYILGYTDS